MPNRQEVLDAIAAINDNGNNTAKEMRTVLNLLLEHGEENPSGQSGGTDLEPFNIAVTNPIKSTQSDAEFYFSFRGFRKFHGNLTFGLSFENIDPGERSFHFEMPDEMIDTLKELGVHAEGPRLTFVVPLIPRRSDFLFDCILHISVNDDRLFVLDLNYRFDNIDGEIDVSTSIHFHLPKNVIND